MENEINNKNPTNEETLLEYLNKLHESMNQQSILLEKILEHKLNPKDIN